MFDWLNGFDFGMDAWNFDSWLNNEIADSVGLSDLQPSFDLSGLNQSDYNFYPVGGSDPFVDVTNDYNWYKTDPLSGYPTAQTQLGGYDTEGFTGNGIRAPSQTAGIQPRSTSTTESSSGGGILDFIKNNSGLLNMGGAVLTGLLGGSRQASAQKDALAYQREQSAMSQEEREKDRQLQRELAALKMSQSAGGGGSAEQVRNYDPGHVRQVSYTGIYKP